MRIIVRVTGKTILGICLQSRKRRCPHMTLRTLYIGMFALQLKFESVMVKVVPEAVYPIMTFETILPEGHHVLDHERHVHADVTFLTGDLVELGDVLPVTIRAKERLIRRRKLVAL